MLFAVEIHCLNIYSCTFLDQTVHIVYPYTFMALFRFLYFFSVQVRDYNSVELLLTDNPVSHTEDAPRKSSLIISIMCHMVSLTFVGFAI